MTVSARSLPSITGSVAMALAMTGETAFADTEIVDVQLVIAADVSLSMSYEELQIQREGYIAALTHDSVIRAIEDGAYGRIALAMFEWAGDQSQHMVVPWTVIASRADAEAVAARMAGVQTNSARRTSISGALDFAGDLFAESDYRGLRRVVDISGDGPNNQGGPVVEARERLVAQGIVVNGLPMMTDGGMSSVFDVPNLDEYYSNCVIGGPGAFVVPVNDWDQFPEAVRRKLVLELAGPWSPTWRDYAGRAPVIAVSTVEAYDCLIGEKRWMNRSWNFP
ncbi:DUF1194 domain-containing protein [Aliihoeflea aestuarii]|uniref:DUF1194 domain-containing protein n=1 Tax=Aliihoeflea aestuarii TaxID=453840 RepID=UPI00209392A0|nr:DUF1194 domain-containing protein [Aliihoeflea aestuarii]MCO6390778.1 DUF1194 domain-containing protein [Aliihoeflea aestuarii]